ncbi:hypothetical protein [Methanolobus sp. WCC5]|uniref:hypothetical protein n=1 Tax=Methanolobus sp. WCC5 TaxID=3125785 RepID=UPI00324972B2
MNVTFFHFGALFFGLVAVYNLYSALKHRDSCLPAFVGAMMFILFVLFIFLPWQYGYLAFLLTAMFSVIIYRKSCDIQKEKMKRFVGNSKDTDQLKFVDYFTGWKLLHRWNNKYGPKKASLINSIIMWVFGITIGFLFTYLWPDIFSNMWHHIVIVMTIIMLGFYWQNKRLLESLDNGNPAKDTRKN